MTRNCRTEQGAIGAAECAARTGLSLRALRVYEQLKLVKPARSANGWRRYVAADLARLNTIRVLKSLGLSLSRIREVLEARSPSVREVLQVQALAWKSRKQAAEKAIELVNGALRHLEQNSALSMEALCELLRMYALNPVVPEQDEMLRRNFPPDDSRRWSQWWAEHPDELAESARFSEAQLAVFNQLKSLMDAGSDPAGARAQALMRTWESLFLSHHVRERTIRQLAWNHDVTFNWFELVHKNRVHQYAPKGERTGAGLYTPQFAAYLAGAYQNSAHGKALAALRQQVAEAIAAKRKPRSVEGRAIGQRFAVLCEAHSLGAAETYAGFALFIEQVNHGRDAVAEPAAWRYLVEALGAVPRGGRATGALPGRRPRLPP